MPVNRPARFGIEQDFADALGFDDFHAERRLRRGSGANGIEQAVVCVVVVGGLSFGSTPCSLARLFYFAAGEQIVDGRFGNVAGASSSSGLRGIRLISPICAAKQACWPARV